MGGRNRFVIVEMIVDGINLVRHTGIRQHAAAADPQEGHFVGKNKLKKDLLYEKYGEI